MLESRLHAHNAFVTLTFAEPAPVQVHPKELQAFMKKLRKIYPAPIRFFGVGEYGDKSWRPHYHLALFGVSFLDQEFVERAWTRWDSEQEKVVSKGFVQMGELNEKSAAYLCGYVTKKLTKREDERLDGRHPEFTRMSLRPGIGGDAARVFAAGYSDRGGAAGLALAGDVSPVVSIGRSKMPMGRYIRERTREALGMDKKMPASEKERLEKEYALLTAEDKALIQRKREAAYDSMVARLKIKNSKKVI